MFNDSFIANFGENDRQISENLPPLKNVVAIEIASISVFVAKLLVLPV